MGSESLSRSIDLINYAGLHPSEALAQEGPAAKENSVSLMLFFNYLTKTLIIYYNLYMEKFLIKWLILTLAILLTGYILNVGSTVSVISALVAALVLGIVNVTIKPLLVILTLPISILSLGFFTLIINALMILAVSAIVPGFSVDGFWFAVLFGVVLSIINCALSLIFKENE